MPTELTFEDKVVLVTGGTRGLGWAMVNAFAERGASVVIASRKAAACEAAAAQIAGIHGVRALAVAGNVSSWDDCDEIAERSYDEFKRVDVLINNAGVSPLYPDLSEVTEDLFDKVLAVNLRGPFRLMANIGKRMRAAGSGSIVNITSIEAVRPNPRSLPYAAAKAGLNAMTVGFAQALGPAVRVNAIQAGPFLTDISTNWPSGVRAEFETAVALGRCGQPGEIVGAALYFAGESSSYCTGAVLPIDGGWR